jgi:heterotetrameric sarcosine oxidase gamma subunit
MSRARSPLHHWHAAQGARFADRDGWQIVTAYSDPQREVEAARHGLGLADISAFAKISLRGLGVKHLVASLSPDGAAQSPGGVISVDSGPALSCRLTKDHLLLLAPTPTPTVLGQRLATLAKDQPVILTDVTSAYAGFVVVGPRWEELLRRLTSLDLRPNTFPMNSCTETALAGVEAILVRSSESSLPCLRIYVAWDLGEYVWERILEAGREQGLLPLGLEALGLLGVLPGQPKA